MAWLDNAVDKFMNKWHLPTASAEFLRLFTLAPVQPATLTPCLCAAQVLATKGENHVVPSSGPALSTTTNLKD